MNPTRSPITTREIVPWSALHPSEIDAEMERLDQARYRADQLKAALWRRGVWDWEEMTELPKELRRRLADVRPLRTLVPQIDRTSPSDGSNKVLFAAADGGLVETVLMRARGGRHTICVSSQIGCPAACSFCASGLGSFTRNLGVAEIVDQVDFFARKLDLKGGAIDNVVFMGMGEPFLNYSRVMKAIERLRDASGLGLGARRITVSTVGIVPAIHRFAAQAGAVNLAISLHAPNDELRSRLVPYNRQFPITGILDAVSEYIDSTHRRVSFEYVLLSGTNDQPDLASSLADLLRPLVPLVHVNLIPWNPFEEAHYRRSTREAAQRFEAGLRRGGINATIRYSKGLDIDAACGQLRHRSSVEAVAS